ncbi:hypothetical protein FGG79_12485 [Bacillus sp. BHET2]|nr:hypothetical protein FGG79_12485 [Bacillus sp. BHET2]
MKMDQTSTDNPSCQIRKMMDERSKLRERIQELEKEVKCIQDNCKHVFYETVATRSCIKCHYAESTYY